MTVQRNSPVALPPIFDRARIIGTSQAAAALGFSVPHLRRLYRSGRIPKPIRIGGQKVGWPAGVIADLIMSAASEASL